MAESPTILVIGGPNGAGKSTLTQLMLRQFPQVDEFLNADIIARGLSRANVDDVAYESGRVMIERMEFLARHRYSFGVESTLSGKSLAMKLRRFKIEGYQLKLVYVTLDFPDLSVQRVHQRVLLGGHDIPIADIQRRFLKTHRNFWTMYRYLADNWYVYDNSDSKNAFQLIGEGISTRSTMVFDSMRWQKFLDRAQQA